MLALHDVPDAEALVAAIIRRSPFNLSREDREDLQQHLLLAAWELSLKYEPDIIDKGFGCWATIALKRRLIDHQRSKFRTKWQFKDRVYERPRVQFVDLDRLAGTLAALDGDPAADRDAPSRGLFDSRDRERARDLELLGLGKAA